MSIVFYWRCEFDIFCDLLRKFLFRELFFFFRSSTFSSFSLPSLSRLLALILCPALSETGEILFSIACTWSDNNVRELIAMKVLYTSLLNTTVVAFKLLPLGSYAPMSVPSPPFKTIMEPVLSNDVQSCRCIIPDVINVVKIPSLQYFIYLREQKKSHWGLHLVNRQGVPTRLSVSSQKLFFAFVLR